MRDYVIPPEAEQRKIAEALGLQPDYFEEGDLACYLGKRAKKLAVQRLNVKTAAELLKMSQMTLQRGLQQGVFPWGYAIKSKDKETYSYFINAKRFVEIEGIEVNA